MGETFAAVRRIFAESRQVRVTFLAAAVAYYAFVSLIPLLLLLLAVGSYVGGEQLSGAVVAEVGRFLSPEGEAVVTDALAGETGRSGATIIGLVVLLWTALKAVRAVDDAVSQVYHVTGPDSLPRQLLDGAVVLGALGLGGVLTVVLNGFVPARSGIPILEFLSPVITAGVLVVTFLPLYYVFPDVPMTVREAFPGAVIAAIGWALLGAGFQIYAALAGTGSLYGVLGGVLLLVTVLYGAAIVILMGAVANAVLSGRIDDEEDATEPQDSPDRAPDITELSREVEALRTRLEERTVDRDALEADLKGYIRQKIRRGHARGWGPYLVLLYGTAMTVAAFWYLSGLWAISAMLIVWLSTLGLYVLMLIVGVSIGGVKLPGRMVEWVRSRR